MANPAQLQHPNIYEWREQCSVLKVKIKNLEEKIVELTKDRDEWKERAIQLENAILTYIGS